MACAAVRWCQVSEWNEVNEFALRVDFSAQEWAEVENSDYAEGYAHALSEVAYLLGWLREGVVLALVTERLGHAPAGPVPFESVVLN